MGISGVNVNNYYQSQPVTSQEGSVQEGERMAAALRERQENQPTLTEMMKEVKQRADERDRMLNQTRNPMQYGQTAIQASSKLARARSLGEVDVASGYARRQIARLRAAKRSDSDNADRIQAAINQLQKTVNRAGRKKRELTQEKTSAARQTRLEKEKRIREAKRQRAELNRRKASRMVRESGYVKEAVIDNRIQGHLSAAKLELRSQMQELTAATQTTLETAIQGYTASSAEAVPAPELNIEA